ncbi:MAG TPA: transglutaminase-like domain-containing protein [Elusimicrobiota bacterium]|nr:transglutaminase-like domain-containing protein [Elusimicrobiota bacterium]
MKAKKRITERDVRLLMTFLADRGQRSAALAKLQLKSVLRQRPSYRKVLENADDPELAREARLFLEETRLEMLVDAFRALAAEGEDLNLERGAFLLATLAYPQLRPSQVSGALNRMAADIQARQPVAELPSDAEQAAVLRRYLFEQQGFVGNERQYYDPDNSFINRVLERRTGIPITLSCVYLFVAWRLGLPAHGVGLPGHFIVAHGRSPAVVYLDPFHGGRLLTRNDCVAIVRRRGVSFQDAFLERTSPRQILLRMILNLMNLYTEQGATARAQWLSGLLGLLQDGGGAV